MEPKDRMIVALDVNTLSAAEELVEALSPHVGCFKVGLELLTAEGFPRVVEVFHYGYGARLFIDGKFHDIPNTVAGAVRAAVRPGVSMMNVHCLGGPEMLKAAAEATRQAPVGPFLDARPLVLGVTILTSLDYDDFSRMGLLSALRLAVSEAEAECTEPGIAAELVREKQGRFRWVIQDLAALAQACGLDGVIASPQETQLIRQQCGPGFLIVTPGVRPPWAATDDQKRVMTPAAAIAAGADYLVIGRPITKPPKDIGSPVDAVKRIAEEIAAALPETSPKGG